MTTKIRIAICENLQAEAEAVLAAGQWPELEIVTFPARCGRPQISLDELSDLQCNQEVVADTHVLGSCCIQELSQSALSSPKVTIHHSAQCFYPLCSRSRIDELLTSGCHLITPGWLKKWPDQISIWGFDQAMARDFFSRSATKIVLLETGVWNESQNELQAFGHYIDRPVESTPVDLDYLQLQFHKIVLESRDRKAQQLIERLRDQSFQLCTALDFFGKLSQTTNEQQIIEGIVELFTLLIAPGEIEFIPQDEIDIINGQESRVDHRVGHLDHEQIKRDGYAWTGSEGGFLLLIRSDNTTFGFLKLDKLSFPEHKKRYLNFALSIRDICALALHNARVSQNLLSEIALREDTEQSLVQSEKRFRLLYENAPLPYQSLDVDGKLLDVNQAWLDALGYRKEEVVCRSFTDFILPELADHFARNFPRFKEAGSIEGVEFEMVKKDTTTFPVVFTGRVSVSPTGEFLQSHCIFRDVGEQKRQEALKLKDVRLQEQHNNIESLKTMAHAIAHRFNNAMMAVMGNLSLLTMTLPADSSDKELATDALAAAKGASKIGTMMLTYSGQDSGTMKVENLTDVIRESLAALRDQFTPLITLKLTTPREPLYCALDSKQIKEVMSNVLLNGIESFENETGIISVRFGSAFFEVSTFPILFQNKEMQDGMYSFCEITDNGQGIANDDLQRIFDPFYTTKFVGRGLGLALAAGIMKGHHGAVTVSSTVGEGTTCKILFPALPASQDSLE
ncbi:MAG: PAS domain S-box protein [Desulfobulbaceae bacterium]|uniref:histidine kinase n=1 Tax=Candidatus Desulfatifera sulfidica TaxID=2841691 RepID=A0A8J6N7T3_9BACT|nr:PAS domain S-box protein [Candidatus Desulfatifera sulfidica]